MQALTLQLPARMYTLLSHGAINGPAKAVAVLLIGASARTWRPVTHTRTHTSVSPSSHMCKQRRQGHLPSSISSRLLSSQSARSSACLIVLLTMVRFERRFSRWSRFHCLYLLLLVCHSHVTSYTRTARLTPPVTGLTFATRAQFAQTRLESPLFPNHRAATTLLLPQGRCHCHCSHCPQHHLDRAA